MAATNAKFDWPSTGPDDPLHRPKHARALKRVRAVCLALPEAGEKISRGHTPIFTARGKNFAIVARTASRPSVWLAAPEGAQRVLTEAEPERYYVPPYLGGRGWVGAWLDVAVQWGALEDLLREGHQIVVEKTASRRR